MKTIFLDFDGVLFDTAKEAYILSRYAYYDINPFEQINSEEYTIFYKNKYLVTNSWQYFYLIKSLKYDDVEKNFKNLVLNRSDEDRLFDKKFQKCRQDLMKNHFNFWNNLDTPYPLFDAIKKLINNLDIVIVSTKNTKAISNKLKQYDFNIPNNKIIGKEILNNYKSKGDFLLNYIKDNHISNAIFVDDSKENLDSCKSINNIQLLLADWGYCNPNFAGQSCQSIMNKIKEGV